MGGGNIMAVLNGNKYELSDYEMRMLINLARDYDPGGQITPAGLALVINKRKPHRRNRFLLFFKCKKSKVEHYFKQGLVIEGHDISQARRLGYYFGEIRKELKLGTKK
jgi:hypothetical protein